MTHWFLIKNGEEIGPLPPSVMRKMAAQGKLRPESMIRKEGMQLPVPASRVSELFPIGEPAMAIAKPARQQRVLQWVATWASRIWKGMVDSVLLLRDDARRWARGRSWLIRLPLILYGFYQLALVVGKDNYMRAFSFDYLNLTIHEMGHLATRVLGTPISCPMGTIAQLALPIGAVIIFLRQRDYFAMSFCFCWLGKNLSYVSWYMSTAPRPNSTPMLKILGPNVEYVHDFNYMFSQLGVLHRSAEISFAVYVLAVLSCLFFIVTGSWLLYRMMIDRG